MTLPPAALPGHSLPTAPVEFRAHLHDGQQLGCPACGNGQHLVATYTVHYQQAIEAERIPGVSEPEVRPGAGEAEPVPDHNRPTKVACTNCRWSYTGPDPLARLQEAS